MGCIHARNSRPGIIKIIHRYTPKEVLSYSTDWIFKSDTNRVVEWISGFSSLSSLQNFLTNRLDNDKTNGLDNDMANRLDIDMDWIFLLLLFWVQAKETFL